MLSTGPLGPLLFSHVFSPFQTCPCLEAGDPIHTAVPGILPGQCIAGQKCHSAPRNCKGTERCGLPEVQEGKKPWEVSHKAQLLLKETVDKERRQARLLCWKEGGAPQKQTAENGVQEDSQREPRDERLRRRWQWDQADGEAGCDAVTTRPPLSPRGTLKLGWPFRVIPSWSMDQAFTSSPSIRQEVPCGFWNQKSLLPEFESSLHPSTVGPWTRTNIFQQRPPRTHLWLNKPGLLITAVRENTHQGVLVRGS
eukprot:XP_016860946.1 uncharacterized protein LOC107985856 isoform X1 [Homo sapiens]